MAVSLQKAGGQPNTYYMEFYCDTVSELATLPTTTTKGAGAMAGVNSCPMGSCCYCFEDGSVYGLSSSGWKSM